jgi:hypothetical protein
LPTRPDDLRRQRVVLPATLSAVFLASVAIAYAVNLGQDRARSSGLADPVEIGGVAVRLPSGWEAAGSWAGLLNDHEISVTEPRRRDARKMTVSVYRRVPREWDQFADEAREIEFGDSGIGRLLSLADAEGNALLLAEGRIGTAWVRVALASPRATADVTLVRKVAASLDAAGSRRR